MEDWSRHRWNQNERIDVGIFFTVNTHTVKPSIKTTWEIGTPWELRTATSVPRSIHYIAMDLRNKTTSEFRTVFGSPLGVPNSQVPLYISSPALLVWDCMQYIDLGLSCNLIFGTILPMLLQALYSTSFSAITSNPLSRCIPQYVANHKINQIYWILFTEIIPNTSQVILIINTVCCMLLFRKTAKPEEETSRKPSTSVVMKSESGL